MEKKPRRRFWLRQPFQVRYTTQLVAILLFFVILNGAFIYLAIGSALKGAFSDKKLEGHFEVLAKLQVLEQKEAIEKPGFDPSIFENPNLVRRYQQSLLADVLTRTNLFLLISLGISLPLVVFLSIFWSHRVVGPLVRIRHMMDELREGDLQAEIRLRKEDELRDLAEELTFVGRRFRERMKGLKDKVERLRKLQSSLENALRDPKESSAIEFYVKSLARELGEFAQALQQFRTGFSE